MILAILKRFLQSTKCGFTECQKWQKNANRYDGNYVKFGDEISYSPELYLGSMTQHEAAQLALCPSCF